jgi:hypothetical protein
MMSDNDKWALENAAYELTFSAVELVAAAGRIDMRGLHHRYNAGTAARLLRKEAARRLRLARRTEKATCRKVWVRHINQVRTA